MTRLLIKVKHDKRSQQKCILNAPLIAPFIKIKAINAKTYEASDENASSQSNPADILARTHIILLAQNHYN